MLFNSYFEDYLEYLRQEGKTEETIKAYKRMLYGVMGHCPITEKRISELKLTDIALIMESAREHGKTGPLMVIKVLKSYLKFLEDSGIELPIKLERIKTPKIPNKEQSYLTEDELRRLLDSIPVCPFENLRTKTLLEVLFSTGMRIGEALKMEWDDINWFKKEIVIVQKGGDERIAYLTSRAIYWLKEYREVLRRKNKDLPWIFINKNFTGPLARVSAEAYLLKHQGEWNLEKHITYHTLRRTLATFLMEKKMELQNICLTIGWKSPRTVLRYYAIANRERARKTHQRLANL